MVRENGKRTLLVAQGLSVKECDQPLETCKDFSPGSPDQLILGNPPLDCFGLGAVSRKVPTSCGLGHFWRTVTAATEFCSRCQRLCLALKYSTCRDPAVLITPGCSHHLLSGCSDCCEQMDLQNIVLFFFFFNVSS